ncbi:MAG: hypothetical protein KF888_06420 [Nitrosomonas sp.]|nr:hypothetical protein [Nitrosomonas sp.]
MTNNQNEHIEPNLYISDNSLNEVNGIHNDESDEFFLNIKNDLNQIDRLVSDAVNNLVINFKFISQLTKSHYEMVMAIEKLAIPNESEPVLELLKRQMMIADKIEHELGAAITSLQFGDLVTQLLAHTSDQLDVFIRVLQRIDRHSNLQREDKLIDGGKNVSQAMRIARSRNKKKPVIQQAMHNGEIELF